MSKTNLRAVVLRCPFKISSTAIEDIYFGPCSISALKSQYFSSKKPKHWPDKVSTLIWLTQRIVFANAPHCVFEGTLIVMRVCKFIFDTPSLWNYSKYGPFPFNRSLMNTGEFPTSLKCFLPIYKSTVINAFGLSWKQEVNYDHKNKKIFYNLKIKIKQNYWNKRAVRKRKNSLHTMDIELYLGEVTSCKSLLWYHEVHITDIVKAEPPTVIQCHQQTIGTWLTFRR